MRGNSACLFLGIRKDEIKIRLKAENPLEWMALKLNLAPTPLIDTQVAFNAAVAIMVAAELGIFEASGKLSRTADEIARTCQTNPRSTADIFSLANAPNQFISLVFETRNARHQAFNAYVNGQIRRTARLFPAIDRLLSSTA